MKWAWPSFHSQLFLPVQNVLKQLQWGGGGLHVMTHKATNHYLKKTNKQDNCLLYRATVGNSPLSDQDDIKSSWLHCMLFWMSFVDTPPKPHASFLQLESMSILQSSEAVSLAPVGTVPWKSKSKGILCFEEEKNWEGWPSWVAACFWLKNNSFSVGSWVFTSLRSSDSQMWKCSLTSLVSGNRLK